MEDARKYLVVLEVQVEAPGVIGHKVPGRLGNRIRDSIAFCSASTALEDDGLKLKALTVYKPFLALEVTR